MHALAAAPRTDSEIKRDIKELHRSWISEVSRLTGKPPTPLATGAGLSETALSRLFDEDYSGSLSPVSIYKVCRAYDVPGPDEFAAQGNRLLTGYAEAEAFQPNTDPEVVAAVEALIAGRPHIEAWVLRTYSLEGARLGPGDVVLLDPTAQPADGDAVCARVGEQKIWRVFRGNFLLDETLDPRDRSLPYMVDNHRTTLVGTVRGMIRPPSLPASV